jgi:hypothetical protein
MPWRGPAAAPRRARVPGSRSPLRARRRIIARAACTGPRGSGVGQSVRGGRLTTGGSRCNGCVYMGGRRRRREIAGWGHSRISPSDARAPARAQPVPAHADGGPAVIRAIFDAPDGPEAERLCRVRKEYQEISVIAYPSQERACRSSQSRDAWRTGTVRPKKPSPKQDFVQSPYVDSSSAWAP